MHFKSLQLVGFKSFAEKTVIGFEPGITAIVGPNGCGKSNVSDAIRWVLGEQNARNLRGSLMEDLIFSGSSEMGAMGMAEVSLTLGNARTLADAQDDEVTVSRRLFRSGESQYFFNKQPCRLKDIQKVFMDTGLGTKAYSYIQQGNIDLILSSRPEDRRFLFDETAGITKYKADKKEAVRKLEATENNLLRLNDLVREVKRQMISIQRQAGKARRYKDVADELQGLDVGFLLHKRAIAAAQQEALQDKRQTTETLLRHLTQEIEAREEHARNIRAELQSSSLKHEELQSRKLDLLRSIDREAGNISLCKQRIADTQTLQDKTAHEIKTMRQKGASLESAIRERQDSLDALRRERTQCEKKLKEKEGALEATAAELRRCEAEVSELSNRLLEVIRREIETRGKVASTGEKLAENERVLAEVRRGKEEILRCLAEKEKASQARSEDKQTLLEQVQQEKERLVALRAEMKETGESLVTLRKEILEAEGTLSRLNSERHFLTEAVEQYEGYDAGVREVIEESKREDSRLRGIIGTVADLIDVPPRQERVAEAALDTRLQWVVTKTIDDARRAAAFLAQRSRGRATFLPLEAIREPEAGDSKQNTGGEAPGSVGEKGKTAEERKCTRRNVEARGLQYALGLVSAAPKYKAVVHYLLGDVVLVENLDRAIELAASEPHLTVVTMSGERIRKATVITAGKTSTTVPSLVSRKSRIAAIVLEEQDCRQRLSDLREKERDLVAVQRSLEENSEEQMAAISGAGDRVVKAEKGLLDLSTAIETLRSKAEELTARQTQTESDQERLGNLRKTLAEELRSASEEKAEAEKAIVGARAKLERVQKEVALHKENATEVSVVRFSFDERIANLQSDTEYMRGQLDLTQKELEARQQQIEQGKATIRSLEKQIEEGTAATVSLNKQKDEVTAAIERFEDGRKVLADELSQVEWEVKEKSRAVREREKEKADLDIKLTEIRFTINSIDEHLMTEYGLTTEDPRAVPLPDKTDWDEVQAKIADLKRKLQSLGPVNLCAIEEYEALKERHDFLLSQQSDLIEAKDALLKAIAKLDRESKILFRETFERVREEFQRMFLRLFGGGRADLFLTDESNLLESGIEIIARPPGKKLQAISLLSGGERAMTAISLLFAIFKVKPSPFCILDEIDAPLDDSNIGRFAEVLREFTEDSQFIVITHNKRTISASDILYGITMEESGKSKVVSARLTRGKEGTSVQRAEVPSTFSREETALVTA